MRHALACSVICAAILAFGSPASAQVSFGITIGQPPPPRAYRVPPRPGRDYLWVEGYWYPQGNGKHYKWHDGYWTRPPFAGAYWVDPYYYGGRYVPGYWEDGRRRANHDHHWDNDRNRRDDGRDKGHDNDHR